MRPSRDGLLILLWIRVWYGHRVPLRHTNGLRLRKLARGRVENKWSLRIQRIGHAERQRVRQRLRSHRILDLLRRHSLRRRRLYAARRRRVPADRTRITLCPNVHAKSTDIAPGTRAAIRHNIAILHSRSRSLIKRKRIRVATFQHRARDRHHTKLLRDRLHQRYADRAGIFANSDPLAGIGPSVRLIQRSG
ncbi:hypothetical protein D3C71_1652920 [compost metagenome]